MKKFFPVILSIIILCSLAKSQTVFPLTVGTSNTNVVTSVGASYVQVKQLSGSPITFFVNDSHLARGTQQISPGGSYTFFNASGWSSGSVVGSISIPSGPFIVFNVTQSGAGGNSPQPSPTPVMESLGTKLRRLELSARTNNPSINPPLILPSAWQANAAYARGTVVSNNGLYYLCGNGGTSAGSGGPTGTGVNVITDNTVSWFYYGAINESSSQTAIAPALSILASATPPSPYTKTYGINQLSSFFFAGGVLYPYPTPVQMGIQTVQTVIGQPIPSASGGGSVAVLEFMTDAPKFYVAMCGNGQRISIIVDDSPAVLQTFDTNVLLGVNQYLIVDFTSAGGRKVRHIRLEQTSLIFGSGTSGIGVATTIQDNVWPPSANDHIRAIFVTDSYGQVDPLSGTAFPYQVSKMMGWDDCWADTWGGSGYQSNFGGGLNYVDRVQDITLNNPDIVILTGGLNDPATGETAAVFKELSLIRASLPIVPIVVFGVPTPGGGNSNTPTENAIKAAVLQFNDPLIFFVPVNTDPLGAWLTGTGNVSAPNNTGNNDVYTNSDTSHPTFGGATYLSQKMIRAIKNILPQIP